MALTALTALMALAAHAHEADDAALPEDPGWRLGATVAAVLPRAERAWPAPAWPGLLIDGQTPRDQHGRLALEHATLDAALRLTPRWALQGTLGWHDGEGAHVETARAAGRWDLGPGGSAGELRLSLGRDQVRGGAVLDGAGHFDRFGAMPIAKLAATKGNWIEDGLRLGWHRFAERGLRGVELGLWRGRAFPGGAGAPPAATLHLHGGWDHVDAHLLLGHVEPEGRGAVQRLGGSTGHSHGSLDCRRSLQQRVCLDGGASLLQASLRWSSEDERWYLGGALIGKREAGLLSSTSAAADWRSTQWGGWVDISGPLPLASTASWALRLEQLRARQQLVGTGASGLAREAGLDGARQPWRATLALLQPLDWLGTDWQLSAEAGQEHSGLGRQAFAALRLIWRGDLQRGF